MLNNYCISLQFDTSHHPIEVIVRPYFIQIYFNEKGCHTDCFIITVDAEGCPAFSIYRDD